MHKLNSDAIQHLADFNRQLFLIEIDDEMCTNATKSTYEKNTGKTYAEMNDCLLGKTPVPKPTDPSTTEPPTTTTTTEEPTTTTTTVEPESEETAPEDKMPEEDIYMLRQALEKRLKRHHI